MTACLWICVIASATFYVITAYFSDKYEYSGVPLFWYATMILSAIILLFWG